jgi:hypothetical protein
MNDNDTGAISTLSTKSSASQEEFLFVVLCHQDCVVERKTNRGRLCNVRTITYLKEPVSSSVAVIKILSNAHKGTSWPTRET